MWENPAKEEGFKEGFQQGDQGLHPGHVPFSFAAIAGRPGIDGQHAAGRGSCRGLTECAVA